MPPPIAITESQPFTGPEIQTQSVESSYPSGPEDEPSKSNVSWTTFLTLEDGKRGRFRSRRPAPVAYGGFSDIWICDARLSTETHVVVAVKRLRPLPVTGGALDGCKSFQKLAKRLMKELNIWMTLQHLNIAPLLGFTFTPEMCLISPWFTNGNLANFIAANPFVNRKDLVKGIAEGLAYLHGRTPAIVHGDIKPDNVLIDGDGVPMLIDFGLSKLLESDSDPAVYSCTSLREAGNTRWIAPELLLQDGASRSCSTDVFSFGCLAFFTLTGDVPFKGLTAARLIVARCVENAQPIRPNTKYPVLDAAFGVKEILSACWGSGPVERPTMHWITQQLKPAESPQPFPFWWDARDSAAPPFYPSWKYAGSLSSHPKLPWRKPLSKKPTPYEGLHGKPRGLARLRGGILGGIPPSSGPLSLIMMVRTFLTLLF